MNFDYWATLGKLAVIATVLTAVFKFVAWWRAPKEKLVAKISQSDFQMPPSVNQAFAALRDKINGKIECFFDGFAKDKQHYDEGFSRAETLAEIVKLELDPRFTIPYWSTRGCWHAEINNNGRKKCTGVSLYLPHAVVAEIRREGDLEPEIAEIRNVISIGELRPRGRCVITAWTDYPVRNSDNRDAHISHDGGFGRIFAEWKTNRIGWVAGTLMDRENVTSLLIPLIVAPLLGVLAASLMLGALAHNKTKKSPSTPSSATIPTPTATQR